MKNPLFEKMAIARKGILKSLGDSGIHQHEVTHKVKNIYASNTYPEKISEEGIVAGVLPFAAVNNMQGGSIADMNLYDVVRAYLKNPEQRAKINEAIGR